MASAQPFYSMVIDEIGTQTFARLNLNLFSLVNLDSSSAYGASIQATNDTMRAYERHKNNPNYAGQTFEELDIGSRNISDAFFMKDQRTYTTDTLGDIKTVQGMLNSGKKYENLSGKDKQKFDYIMQNYGDEVQSMDFSGNLGELARGNHNTTDTVTLDRWGNVLSTAQNKQIQNTKDLLKDRYLTGEGAVDELRVPYEDYKRHKKELEKMINNGQNSDNPHEQEIAQKAQIALEKLQASNLCNRLMSENPQTAAVLMQGAAASGHIAMSGLGDAIIVALSTLANGIIWEVKDMYQGSVGSQASVLARIKRLLQRTLDAFMRAFKRSAGFGAIDAVIGVVSQIFQSIAGALRQLWGQIKTSGKAIYNAIVAYYTGHIKSFRELLGTILKALFSAAWITGVLGLEKQLEVTLAGIVPPLAPFLSPILAIVAGAFAVAITHRSIDMALDVIFNALAARDAAKLRAEEIAMLVDKELPALMEKTHELESLIASTHKQRLMSLESSFVDYQNATNGEQVYDALSKINHLWGAELKIKDMDDVKDILQDTNRTGKLKW